jgi:phosphatidylinositol-3-phosphatase
MPSCSRNFRLLQTAELKTEFAEEAKADRDILRYAGVPVTSQCSGRTRRTQFLPPQNSICPAQLQLVSRVLPAAIASLIFLRLPAYSAIPVHGHVVIVMEENSNFSQIIGNSNMPYLNGLAKQYAIGTQYYANTHPSIGNYFELTVGQILTNDDGQTPHSFPVSSDNVVRRLLAAGKTWKAYCESIPSVGYTGGDIGYYAVRHCTLPYMTDVQNNATQVKSLVPFSQFTTDLNSGALPAYSFVAPNLIHDLHNGTAAQADYWLEQNIDPLLHNATFMRDGLLLILFDESDNDNTHGGGRVVWVAVGPKVQKGYSSTKFYQHQSTLRLSLEALGLTRWPNAAAQAPSMAEFFTSAGGAGSAPSITSASSATATVGSPFRYQITASNSPTSYGATGLPSGLTPNTTTGLISGTPSANGSYSVTLKATNGSGTGSATLALTVGAAGSAWFNLISKNSGKCLDVTGKSTSPGVQLQQWTCWGGDNQKFQFTAVPGGYKITAKNSGLQLDVEGGPAATQNGVPIIQWPYWGGSSEIWNFVPSLDGSYSLTVLSSHKCADVTGKSTSNGATIQQWYCTGNANQKWTLVRVQ